MQQTDFIRISRHSLLRQKLGIDSQVLAGQIIPKAGLRLSFRIDQNRTMPNNGQNPMEIDFFEGASNSPFMKFTTEEYLPDGSPNPAFILIEDLDHNQNPIDIISILTKLINSDSPL